MDHTSNLRLPYIMAAQAQKHVTHNEALRALDAVVQLSVKDCDLASPPSTPEEGDRYIVGPAASGAFSGHDGEIAAWQDGAWMFYIPAEGWLAWVQDEGMLYAFSSEDWHEFAGGSSSVNPVGLVGVNTTANEVNKLAVKSDAMLFSHDDVTPGTGDMRQKLNKAAPGNSVSQLYQTGFSGRAETGLTGDDDFHIKVSPDGSAWRDAVVIDKDSGLLSLPQGFDSVQITVAEDGVGMVEAPSKGSLMAFSLVHPVYPQAHISGIVSYDCGASPYLQPLALGTGVESLGSTVPTGTTGTDNKVSLAVDNAGHIYVENRSHHSATPSQFSFTFFGGYRGI